MTQHITPAVERAARAISAASYGEVEDWQSEVNAARAVMLAMRQWTPAMFGLSFGGTSPDEATAIWRATIDAALGKEGP